MANLCLSVKYLPNCFSNEQLELIYERYLRLIRDLKVKIKYYVYELDSRGKLHFHAHILSPKRLKYRRLFLDTFHVWLEPFNDKKGGEKGWYIYMRKKIHKLGVDGLRSQHHRDGITYHNFNSLVAMINEMGETPKKQSFDDLQNRREDTPASACGTGGVVPHGVRDDENKN